MVKDTLLPRDAGHELLVRLVTGVKGQDNEGVMQRVIPVNMAMNTNVSNVTLNGRMT